jgi:diguanylate cyclase (GGDEF)-like protein
MKILIAEDQPTEALFLRRSLAKLGYDVIVATDGEAAWEIIRRGEIQVLISDWMMPRLDGLELCRRIRSSGLDDYTYVILLTSRDEHEDRLVGLRAGADDFLIKPPDHDELTLRLEIASRIIAVHQALALQNDRLAYQAMHDPLTDLPNRRFIQAEVEQILTTPREPRPEIALLSVSVDPFREVNDAYGHHFGDLILQQLTPRLRDAVAGRGIPARIADDVFAVLIKDASAQEATQTAEAIRSAIRKPFVIKGRAIDVSSSVGIALSPEHTQDPTALFQCADLAMDAAKRTGAGYMIYASDRPEFVPARINLLGELRQAIDHGELVLHYQPKVSLHRWDVDKVEALVRWQHPREGLLPPGQFIGLAEDSGLIRPLTLWVLRTALLQCRAWHRAGMNLNVAINLPVAMLRESTLVETISAELEATDALPSWLTIEITESAIMTDAKLAARTLEKLRALGVRISIDDFGTGYSSLAYLRDLPVDELKIGGSFVRELGTSNATNCIVRSIVEIARCLDQCVVGEAAEDAATVEQLADLGLDYVQGFYFSRALPPDELIAWINRNKTRSIPNPISSDPSHLDPVIVPSPSSST